MISASSSGDHLLCFLAGDSEVCGGMVRFPPPLPGRPELTLPDTEFPKLPPTPGPPAPLDLGDRVPVAGANVADDEPPRGGCATAVEGGTVVVDVYRE